MAGGNQQTEVEQLNKEILALRVALQRQIEQYKRLYDCYQVLLEEKNSYKTQFNQLNEENISTRQTLYDICKTIPNIVFQMDDETKERIVKRGKKSTVQIFVQNKGFGTGVIVTSSNADFTKTVDLNEPSCCIITSAHLLRHIDIKDIEIKLQSPSKMIKPTSVQSHKTKDIAIIHIPITCPAFAFDISTTYQELDQVVVFGYTPSHNIDVRWGCINRICEDKTVCLLLTQPGFSGGPVVTKNGKMIGSVVGMFKGNDWETVCVPGGEIKSFLESCRKENKGELPKVLNKAEMNVFDKTAYMLLCSLSESLVAARGFLSDKTVDELLLSFSNFSVGVRGIISVAFSSTDN